MNYICLNISLKEEFQEIFIAELFDMDFEGFEQEGDVLTASIKASELDDYMREEIEDMLTAFGDGAYIINEEIVEPQNWNELWEKSIKPQEIGKFYVRPTWAPPVEDPEKIELVIDPKMAFGTGYHATTRLILEWLPDVINTDDVILDAGTGTGILGIAALKLGAKSAFGFDIDEWSEENAIENIALNHINNFEVKLGSTDVIPKGAEYDVILANINRNALVELIPEFLKYLKKGGKLLLSGLLETDEDFILNHDSVNELNYVNTKQQQEWIAILFEA